MSLVLEGARLRLTGATGTELMVTGARVGATSGILTLAALRVATTGRGEVGEEGPWGGKLRRWRCRWCHRWTAQAN